MIISAWPLIFKDKVWNDDLNNKTSLSFQISGLFVVLICIVDIVTLLRFKRVQVQLKVKELEEKPNIIINKIVKSKVYEKLFGLACLTIYLI